MMLPVSCARQVGNCFYSCSFSFSNVVVALLMCFFHTPGAYLRTDECIVVVAWLHLSCILLPFSLLFVFCFSFFFYSLSLIGCCSARATLCTEQGTHLYIRTCIQRNVRGEESWIVVGTHMRRDAHSRPLNSPESA